MSSAEHNSSIVEQEILAGQEAIAELYDGFHEQARLPIGVIATAIACNTSRTAMSFGLAVHAVGAYQNDKLGQLTRAAGDVHFRPDHFLLGRNLAERVNTHSSVRTVSAADEAKALKVRTSAFKSAAQELSIVPAVIRRPKHAEHLYGPGDRYNSDQLAAIKSLALQKHAELILAESTPTEAIDLPAADDDHLCVDRIQAAVGIGPILFEKETAAAGLSIVRLRDPKTGQAKSYMNKDMAREYLIFREQTKNKPEGWRA